MDPTTDPARRSWVRVPADSHFPIQNLPYGVFRRRGAAHVGVAIGDEILDLTAASREGLLAPESLFDAGDLNAFAALGSAAWRAERARISQLLSATEPTLRDDARLREALLVPRRNAEMLLPVKVGDYTDFYSSKEHATNVGAMLRGADNALMPNWLHLPVAYHGRASSVVVSGTDVRRPLGQTRPDPEAPPLFGPTRSLDYELEVAAVVGPGNPHGEPVAVGEAEGHIFGLVLLNDWSAATCRRGSINRWGRFWRRTSPPVSRRGW